MIFWHGDADTDILVCLSFIYFWRVFLFIETFEKEFFWALAPSLASKPKWVIISSNNLSPDRNGVVSWLLQNMAISKQSNYLLVVLGIIL